MRPDHRRVETAAQGEPVATSLEAKITRHGGLLCICSGGRNGRMQSLGHPRLRDCLGVSIS